MDVPGPSSPAALPVATVGILAVCALLLAGCGGSRLEPADAVPANVLVNGGGPAPPAAEEGAAAPSDESAHGPSTGGPATPTDPTPEQAVRSGSSSGVPDDDGGRDVEKPSTDAGSCTGFRNTTGITDSAITIGNVADISGPVPGIFTAAQLAVKAYVAYFNATSSICGRKLVLKTYDSQTNTTSEAVATQRTCDETFAAVGSMAAFDSAGTVIAKRCGIPEIHAIVTSDERAACPNCFGAEAPGGGYTPVAIPDFFSTHHKAATQKAAMLAVNAAAAVADADGYRRAEESRGWKFVYTAQFDVAEFNYGPYVQQLKSRGVRLVQLYGSAEMAVRMARAMEAVSYRPEVFLLNATQYDKTFAAGGSAVDGAIVYVDFTPSEERSANAELARYHRWLQQVSPGSVPTYFGLFAWSAARLFAEQATRLGGDLTRKNLVGALRSVHAWTGNGLHAPMDVGRKITYECVRFLQLRGGTWRSYGGARYHCDGRMRTP